MTRITSRIAEAKGALVDLLRARPALAGVHVTWGIEEIGDEAICVLDIDPSAQAAAAIGRTRREETFTINLEVTCIAAFEASQRTLTARAVALAGDVEQLLVDNPTLGDVVRVAEVAGVALSEPADGAQREARVPMRITCRQRI
jgi:hypothetical protein